MLIIHPKDRTTSVLSALYEGKDANVISSNCSNKEIEHLLHHVSTQERIMLLGHGSDKGLFYRVQIPFDMRSVIPAICGHSFFKYFYGCKVNVLNRYLGRQTVFFC